MKRRILLSIAPALSVILLSLTSSDSRVAAQNQIRIVADTGVVTLGPNQMLRIAVDGKFGTETETAIRFGQIEYAQSVCNGGICRLAVASQTTSDPIPLMPGEAVSYDIYEHEMQHAVRGVVLSNGRDVQVNAYIINTVTGAFEMNVLRD
jgi:hypothetical protein